MRSIVLSCTCAVLSPLLDRVDQCFNRSTGQAHCWEEQRLDWSTGSCSKLRKETRKPAPTTSETLLPVSPETTRHGVGL
uniref:Uncharacterized protein n=1 Tax=Timema cristinae TaxID=61476 RepID=A0A7R9DBW8_TIMCR|nr:unnamed protein product [Timema cristinae]